MKRIYSIVVILIAAFTYTGITTVCAQTLKSSILNKERHTQDSIKYYKEQKLVIENCTNEIGRDIDRYNSLQGNINSLTKTKTETYDDIDEVLKVNRKFESNDPQWQTDQINYIISMPLSELTTDDFNSCYAYNNAEQQIITKLNTFKKYWKIYYDAKTELEKQQNSDSARDVKKIDMWLTNIYDSHTNMKKILTTKQYDEMRILYDDLVKFYYTF